MVFAGTPNLMVSQTCLGRHCVAEYWMKTGRSMRGTTFCQSVVAFNLILSYLVLQAISHPWTGVVGPRKMSKLRACGLFSTHSQGIAPLSEEHALQFTPHSHRFFYTSVGSTFGFSVSERCAFGNWSEGSTMPKRYDSSFCGEQLTRRGELLGLLQAGWSPPTANAPGLPRAPSVVVGIPRTPTGKPILFGTCAPHQGASASLPPDMLERLSEAALSGLLRYYYRSDLGDRKLHVAKSEHSKIAKCGFLLPSSSVTVSNPDRLLGEGVTLCGHACFNTTCSLESVLKGGADC